MYFRWAHLKGIIGALISLAVSSCMLGPNFNKPAPPSVSTYTQTPLPSKTSSAPYAGKAAKSQRYISNKDIEADWWTLFHSPEINSLVRMGIANSPNIEAAQATLRQAQETYNAQIGNSLFPSVNATVSGQRQRFSDDNIGTFGSNIFNLFNASVAVAYNLDVFGAARRQIESLGAQVDFQQFQLIAAYLTLTSNIVTTAITTASLEGQIAATRNLIREQEKQLTILRNQFRYGGISQASVFSQEALVEQTKATLPPLEKSLAQSQHALAVLVGLFPNNPMPRINLDKLNLPGELPVSLPSNLVKQRPDVRAQEALLHAATAQVGVATANLFPQFNITANGGRESKTISGLSNPGNKVWLIGTQITEPLFQGGALLAQRRGAIAGMEQANAAYRQIVLQAFQNVADSLRALETDARTLRAQKFAEIAARKNLTLAEEQYHLGGASYLTLLTAQQQYHQAVILRIKAQALRYNDTAALFQSLGGGWWNRRAGACDPINPPPAANLRCP